MSINDERSLLKDSKPFNTKYLVMERSAAFSMKQKYLLVGYVHVD